MQKGQPLYKSINCVRVQSKIASAGAKKAITQHFQLTVFLSTVSQFK